MVFFNGNKITKIAKEEQLTCTKIIEFDSAHRVYDADSEKCEKLHGHHYKAEFTFTSGILNNGMIIDFNIIKNKIKNWIDTNWDHNVILSHRDNKLAEAIEDITQQNVFLIENNATAELMAKYLLYICNNELFIEEENIVCIKVKLWETTTSFAEAIQKI